MKRCALALVAWSLALIAVSAPGWSQRPADEAPSLTSLVGEWHLATRVALPNGEWLEGKGELSVKPVLDSKGIQITEFQQPLVEGRAVYFEIAVYHQLAREAQVKASQSTRLATARGWRGSLATRSWLSFKRVSCSAGGLERVV